MESMLKSPSLFKSGSREILFHPTADQKETRAPSMQSFELQEDPSFWKEHNVQVVIRVRPLSSSEISVQGHNRCIRQDSGQTITWSGHPESRFTFDHVADENVSQEKLFKVAGVPMVENCVGGYNSCMFAYGQTGSGKTHTMLGDIEGGTRRHSENCGMTPRVFEHLFSRIQKANTTSNNLQIREDAKKGVYVENLKEVEVSCSRDVIQLLLQGATNRKVATTNMNLASSRSHSVFTCVIESKWECQGVMHHRFARLNLVDLAGSERQKSSGAEGERLKEATNINKSLSTLGLVIMNLVNISNGKSMHVPYRDSKLTFLLQDSLGGNSKTTIIANISPSSCCAQETLSTLKFAQRAKFIRNNAIVNEDASGDVITMRLQIQQLKKEVSRLQSLVNGAYLNKESDNCSVSFPGSPGSFKWDTGMGSLSPLTSDKKFSQAKQREEEIQGLKMRLRLRESGIKRMEAVASGKMSAESHLLQERNELLREIAVLRSQVDRNQEVTRFAMENLQMKEEIRMLKSFYEEGEREIMSEQIQLLENKLLDALDWKLMYEKDLKKDSLELGRLDEDNLLISSQAIQNQREVEVLRKNLNNCLEVKEKLERRVDELVNELEEERKSVNALKEASQFPQIDCPATSRTDDSISAAVDDQMELKTMVEAIAAASEREAEAHEIAIILAKENDELRSKDLELSHQLQDMNEEIENLRGLL
ncbi:Kinesin-like protein KIN12B [Acorus calamus]|uniref:Kinesin-like protein n=1 Tax=Acorus calamus TaxID=4465 RepID=A0AAV9EDN1_ACOCL|nr:Kinesin-like protein KIN12B [Acorus calamus]